VGVWRRSRGGEGGAYRIVEDVGAAGLADEKVERAEPREGPPDEEARGHGHVLLPGDLVLREGELERDDDEDEDEGEVTEVGDARVTPLVGDRALRREDDGAEDGDRLEQRHGEPPQDRAHVEVGLADAEVVELR